MSALLVLGGYLGIGVVLGLLLACSIRNGRQVIALIFGLPEEERPGRQEDDPGPWKFPDRP